MRIKRVRETQAEEEKNDNYVDWFAIGMVSADGKVKRFQKCASFMIRLSRTLSYIHILAGSIFRLVGQLVINYHTYECKKTEEKKNEYAVVMKNI